MTACPHLLWKLNHLTERRKVIYFSSLSVYLVMSQPISSLKLLKLVPMLYLYPVSWNVMETMYKLLEKKLITKSAARNHDYLLFLTPGYPFSLKLEA